MEPCGREGGGAGDGCGGDVVSEGLGLVGGEKDPEGKDKAKEKIIAGGGEAGATASEVVGDGRDVGEISELDGEMGVLGEGGGEKWVML